MIRQGTPLSQYSPSCKLMIMSSNNKQHWFCSLGVLVNIDLGDTSSLQKAQVVENNFGIYSRDNVCFAFRYYSCYSTLFSTFSET
jgi:hypothetical protein